MSVPRINLSKAYVQDEHHRQIQNILNIVDQNSNQINTINSLPSYTTGTYKTEIKLGSVYVSSVTAGQMQQGVETITLANGSGSTARAYSATIPFKGSVVALSVDINPSIASTQTISLYRNNFLFLSFQVASGATNGVVNFPKNRWQFNANDVFFGAVTYTTASSNSTCTFIKLYVELGT